jgi:bifunctional UDP-N-acetylglucosamine pyrophosphorylase/glucosamine-1-phosphate N-acetyltransferase
MQAAAIILAAGEGTRMRSGQPKVAHKILGVPLVRYVVEAVHGAGIQRIVTVVGHRAEMVTPLVTDTVPVVQERQLGTGHAVGCAREVLADFAGPLVVLAGDVPLVRAETIRDLVKAFADTGAACTMLTARFRNPQGYGRVVRDADGFVLSIVEQKDLTGDQLGIEECNVGIYCFDAVALFERIERLAPANVQGEYYLTDVIGLLRDDGLTVAAIEMEDVDEAHGINTRVQLAHVARIMQWRINGDHMLSGVTMTAPDMVWVSPGVTIGRDAVIEPMTVLSGQTTVGEGAVVGPNTRIDSGTVGARATVEQSVVRGARIGEDALVGPNAFLRPGTVLEAGSKVGSFVEVKNSTIGEGSKVPHLSYVGDATVGRDVNIGAGSITCNYDGFAKHPTVIGDNAFIGSDTMLVAPVEIGRGAMTAAGSAITKDVPAGALGVERDEQRNIEGWAERRRAANEDSGE